MIDDRDFIYASDTEWDRAEAREKGAQNSDCPWISTDRDVWHVNPFWGKYDKWGNPLQKQYPYKNIPHPEEWQEPEDD